MPYKVKDISLASEDIPRIKTCAGRYEQLKLREIFIQPLGQGDHTLWEPPNRRIF